MRLLIKHENPTNLPAHILDENNKIFCHAYVKRLLWYIDEQPVPTVPLCYVCRRLYLKLVKEVGSTPHDE